MEEGEGGRAQELEADDRVRTPRQPTSLHCDHWSLTTEKD
jgi:hypothetical protein